MFTTPNTSAAMNLRIKPLRRKVLIRIKTCTTRTQAIGGERGRGADHDHSTCRTMLYDAALAAKSRRLSTARAVGACPFMSAQLLPS